MSRKFVENISESTKHLLEALIDKDTNSKKYAITMYQIGTAFGNEILNRISHRDRVTLACTVEDADYLAKGIIDNLEQNGIKVTLTVFWNKRFKPNNENNISIAPIIKEFHEPGYNNSNVLIIIKSIISSSCVVRTNLTKLVEESNPEQILVVAPVLLHGATAKLESEFDKTISSKFQYLYFAIDNEKTDDGIVIPGIGGDVYTRLGFENQADKNKYIPAIVKARREMQIQ